VWGCQGWGSALITVSGAVKVLISCFLFFFAFFAFLLRFDMALGVSGNPISLHLPFPCLISNSGGVWVFGISFMYCNYLY